LEIPGIDKDKIQLNATDDTIEISGEQSEESHVKIERTITYTMSDLTNRSIVAFRFQKRSFHRRSQQK